MAPGGLAAVSLSSLVFADPLAAGSLLAGSAVLAALAGSLHLILYAEIIYAGYLVLNPLRENLAGHRLPLLNLLLF